MKIKLIAASVLAVALLASCGTIPYRTARNVAFCPQLTPLQHPSANNDCVFKAMGSVDPPNLVPRAREAFTSDDKNVPPVFVGLALSGGGSRAANYALAVMEQLEVLGLMRHVTAISSTSGGGLAGAYYALNGPDIDWKLARTLMGTNFLSKWIFSSLRPDHLLTTGITHEDRSDLMADIFDNVLFRGATYAKLGDIAPGRPLFLANATHASRGTRFTFSDKVFRDQLRSRLDLYPISQAVMASAAFPGVFNSVTLKRYPGPVHPSSTRPPIPIGYDHLLDGGPTDNLGIESLLELAVSHQQSRERSLPPGTKQAPCFLFVADAYPPGVSGKKAWEADPRGLVDHFVDLNFLEAFDALLVRRRADLLAYVGLGQTYGASGATLIGDFLQPLSLGDLGSELLAPTRQLVEVDIPRQSLRIGHGWSRIRPVGRLDQQLPRTADGASPPIPEGYFRCTVWHLNLAGILDVKPYVGSPGEQPTRLKNDEAGRSSPLLQHRGRLKRLVSQIETNFKLSGPPNCSKETLQDALYAAAFVVTREDHHNRVPVCDWFEKFGLSTARECRLFPGNQSMLVPVVLEPSGPLVSERPGDSAVHCSIK